MIAAQTSNSRLARCLLGSGIQARSPDTDPASGPPHPPWRPLRQCFRFVLVRVVPCRTACGPPFSLRHKPAPGSCWLLPPIPLTLHATLASVLTSANSNPSTCDVREHHAAGNGVARLREKDRRGKKALVAHGCCSFSPPNRVGDVPHRVPETSAPTATLTATRLTR